MDRNVKILCVDDHPENLLAMEAVLSSPTHQLVGLRSGEDALRYVLKEDTSDVAVILLDVQMPGLNGFETARLIKKRNSSKDIPIIFVTAISKSHEHVTEGYAAGSIDYIFKPYNPELLRMKVEAFVRMHLYHSKVKEQGEMLLRRAWELEESNRKLERSEALSRLISETSTDTIVTFNHMGTIQTVNPAVERMFGYLASELTGQPIWRLLPSFSEEVSTRQGVMESFAMRSDQTTFPVEVQVGSSLIGNQRFYVCSIRDSTVSKQRELEQQQQYEVLEAMVRDRTRELITANEKLRKSQERFKTMFLSSPFLMAIRSVESLTYLDVNDSWEQFTGITRLEALESIPNILEMEAAGDETESICYHQVLRNIKIQYRTKYGEIRDGLLSTEFIEIDEERCVLEVINDVTDKVHYEREMSRLDRLNLVGEMAAGIAHEIRNPMTTIRGFLQLLRKKESEKDKPYFDIMLEELNRANGIITEYLTLAKNKTTDLRRMDVNSIVDTLYPLIQAEALLGNKRVHVDYGRCEKLELDEKEIRQLILNMALNGLEAMQPGGILSIRTYMTNGDVILEIEDEGSGIRREDLEKLGTPFFTTKEQGTGLGLAVCYSIAVRHHARIDVDSGPGGTTFKIRFDRSKAKLQVPESVPVLGQAVEAG